MTLYEIKESVVKAGIKLTETGLIARTWGNVSCRIDKNRFAITPSGRAYSSLTPDDIVVVNISDCSYEGDIKPSSEKGIHADVYKFKPDVNFVIHTHQNNASIISTLDFDSMKADASPLLGKEVLLADYGLPGTKKLRHGVLSALKRSMGNAIIMKNHGALCYGKDDNEAFQTAVELEKACDDFIIKQYLNTSSKKEFDRFEMMHFSLINLTKNVNLTIKHGSDTHFESIRTTDGFTLHEFCNGNDNVTHINLNESDNALSFEAKVHKYIYKKHENINYMIHSNAPDTTAVSCTGIKLKALIDDFAQIVGFSVKTSKEDISEISSALKNASAVFINDNGALCCGASKEDASAVSFILEKGCSALIGASLFEKVKPLNYFDCILMRFVYLKKYSKQANLNK